MEYTDANIPVICAECNEILEGINQVRAHIISSHPDYSTEELDKTVRFWLDDAYEREELNDINWDGN